MPETRRESFAAYYLRKWRDLTEAERRRMHNVRPAGWMEERRREYEKEQEDA
jgi:hypothetical protein